MKLKQFKLILERASNKLILKINSYIPKTYCEDCTFNKKAFSYKNFCLNKDVCLSTDNYFDLGVETPEKFKCNRFKRKIIERI